MNTKVDEASNSLDDVIVRLAMACESGDKELDILTDAISTAISELNGNASSISKVANAAKDALGDPFLSHSESDIEDLQYYCDLISNIVEADYVSCWEEGDITTKCKINTKTMEVFDVEVSDLDYQHFESEYIEITLNGQSTQLDAEDGEPTEAGIKTLKTLLG